LFPGRPGRPADARKLLHDSHRRRQRCRPARAHGRPVAAIRHQPFRRQRARFRGEAVAAPIRGSFAEFEQESSVGPFIRVRSSTFAIRPGEAEELVNEGTYGKALAEYLTEKLRERGYYAPFFCCEDWGWWVELKGVPFVFGVCIYGRELGEGQLDLYVTDG